MTQILFTIAVIVVVIYGSKLLTSMRSKTRDPSVGAKAAKPVNPVEREGSDADLKQCPVCGTYSVSVSPVGCPECQGKRPE